MSWYRIRGHDAIREHFQTAFRRGRLGQAYLFIGPEGVGKRLFALELGKALLCELPPQPLTACESCTSCTLIDAGTHPDFFSARKPDDKHELPIEVVRQFTANFGLKPVRGRRKIGILEDADDFNEESANCFLKTLEEPPTGALLILLATSIDSQLPTILSRCQIVQFQPLSPDVLRGILTSNGVTDPAKLDRLLRLSAGSAGQAIALIKDDLLSFRVTLLDAIAAEKPKPATLAKTWTQFIKDVGKETSFHRERAGLILRLLLDILSQSLRISLGSEAHADSIELPKLQSIADRFGADKLMDLIDKCIEMDYYNRRKVQIDILIENLTDHLTRPSQVSI
jgi:DNA polymerase-3 subunit delta'